MTAVRHIIVAEDHDDQRALFVLACLREGFEVLEATNGHELITLVRACRARGDLSTVVLIISDVMMPGLDGLDAREVLIREGIEVPCLFVSALSDPATRARALSLRALGVFAKPFELKTLRQFLQDHLHCPAQ